MLRNTFTNRLLLVTAVLCTASLLFFANACNEKLGVVDAEKGFPAESVAEFGQGYLIGFHGEPDEELIRNVGGRILRAYNNFPILHVDVPEHAVQELKDNPNVRYVERNSLIHAEKPDGSFMDFKGTGLGIASDPDCEIPNPNVDGEIITEYIDEIGAPTAWDAGAKGNGIRVALFDSGIDREHPDLKDNVADFGLATYAGRDRHWYVDVIGHGTRNAGVIGAHGPKQQAQFGLKGVAPEVELVSVKVMREEDALNEEGEQITLQKVYLDNAIRGIDWSIDRDIHIIYMGWSYLGDPLGRHQAFADAVNSAWNAGILLVASSGNIRETGDFKGETGVFFPAAFDNVIGVSALNADLTNIADFSTFGGEIELIAPGQNIYTTYLNNGYACRNGTAYSAAFVAGAAALVWSADPGLSNEQVREKLQETAENLGLDEKYQGRGLVRPDLALDFLVDPGDPGDDPDDPGDDPDDPGDDPDDPGDGENGENGELSIDDFTLTNTSNRAWARFSVDWKVSGDDLQTVTLTISGPVDDTHTWDDDVSGSSASGQFEFSERNKHGKYTVTLRVTDENGTTEETKEIITL